MINKAEKRVQIASEVNVRESCNHLPESDDDDNDYFEEDSEAMKDFEKRKSTLKKKNAISAEVFVQGNVKDFVPRAIPKTDEQKAKIRSTLMNNFIFTSLDDKQQEIVIDSMEVKTYNEGDVVIKQGEDGFELYIVGTGQLKCTQKKDDSADEHFLKNYQPGEVFGELALMYNAPRAATIVANEVSELYSLDRETFNNIVKVTAIKQRERYENFLQKIEILKDLNEYEKAKICDCLKTERFVKDDKIIQENEMGDKFYFIEEGTADALKLDESGQYKKVYGYKENDYFGELALLKNEARKATIVVTSDRMIVASMDRMSFKRLLGSIENILKRNTDRYVKFTKQIEA
jgi:cAMP-dependent protein kinase regulator